MYRSNRNPQSVIGIIAQSLPLVGVMDYSSPIGPWMILWMAVANALDAFSVLFELIAVIFFRNRKSSLELIFISVIAVLKIGVDIFMTYALRYVSAAVVYLSTAILLHISVLWISAQSHLSHKLRNTQTAPSTTASLLSETPIESLTPSQSTRAEVACFDPQKYLMAVIMGLNVKVITRYSSTSLRLRTFLVLSSNQRHPDYLISQ